MKKPLLTIAIFVSILTGSLQSQAKETRQKPVVCATNVRTMAEAFYSDEDYQQEYLGEALYYTDTLYAEPVGLRCESLNRLRGYLQAINYGTQLGLAAAACATIAAPPAAPVSATVTAFIGIASAAISVVDFHLSYLPCDDAKHEEDLKKLIKEQVCIELQKNGVKCDREVQETVLP